MATRRTVSFSPETLDLFAELERADQRSPDFEAKDRELANLLGLGTEWFCSCCSVLDRSEAPSRSPDYPAFRDWLHVHQVRVALLAAIEAHKGKA